MRDPNRIDEFCEQLRRTWHNYPDWRFGQLVSNIFNISGNPSFFYREDDESLEWLQRQEAPMSDEEAEKFWEGCKRALQG